VPHERFIKNMSKFETAALYYMILVLGWFLGRFTEAIAVGNLKF
jgi:hypothetical protein